jgi:ABC-type bacteriocin/lantibiotic exporter with double-glycine peptidase domain
MVAYCHNMQNLENDCGSAVVKTILQKYRDNNSFRYLFSDIELTADGYSIFDVENELKKFNIEAESYFLENINELKTIQNECILVVDNEGLNHYIVCHKIKKNSVIISDPKLPDICEMSLEELEKIFLGYVICIEDVGAFLAEKKEKQQSLYQILIHNIPRKLRIEVCFVTGLQLIIPLVYYFIIQQLFNNNFHMDGFMNLIYLLFFVSFSITSYMLMQRNNELRIQMDNTTQQIMINRYFEANFGFDLQNNFNNAIGYLWNLLESSNGVLSRLFLFIDSVYVIVLFSVLTFVSLPLSILFMILFVSTFLIINTKIRQLSNNEKYYISKFNTLTKTIEEYIQSSNDIILFNNEVRAKKRLNNLFDEYASAKLNTGMFESKLAGISKTMGSLMVLVLLTITYFMIIEQKNIYIIASGFYVFFIIVSSFEEIINNWLYYKRSVIGTDYIKEMTNLVIHTSNSSIETEKRQLPEIQKLEYRNIYFDYEKKRGLFKDFSFTLNQGEITGIFGENGSGKSTLAEIIAGVREFDQGYLLINEQITLSSVEQMNLSEQTSVYSPNQHLYTGSLSNNITFNNLFHNETINAKRFFKSSLRENQFVLFNGQNLSVGERQKLLLERCLNKQAKLYIFDEPTGNLDKEARIKLYETLISLKEKNKIVVLISHDSELFDICDKQIYL